MPRFRDLLDHAISVLLGTIIMIVAIFSLTATVIHYPIVAVLPIIAVGGIVAWNIGWAIRETDFWINRRRPRG